MSRDTDEKDETFFATMVEAGWTLDNSNRTSWWPPGFAKQVPTMAVGQPEPIRHFELNDSELEPWRQELILWMKESDSRAKYVSGIVGQIMAKTDQADKQIEHLHQRFKQVEELVSKIHGGGLAASYANYDERIRTLENADAGQKSVNTLHSNKLKALDLLPPIGWLESVFGKLDDRLSKVEKCIIADENTINARHSDMAARLEKLEKDFDSAWSANLAIKDHKYKHFAACIETVGNTNQALLERIDKLEKESDHQKKALDKWATSSGVENVLNSHNQEAYDRMAKCEERLNQIKCDNNECIRGFEGQCKCMHCNQHTRLRIQVTSFEKTLNQHHDRIHQIEELEHKITGMGNSIFNHASRLDGLEYHYACDQNHLQEWTRLKETHQALAKDHGILWARIHEFEHLLKSTVLDKTPEVITQMGSSCSHPDAGPPKLITCARCHTHEIDHIIPFSQGGSNEPDNLRLLCIPCHLQQTQDLDNGIKQDLDLTTTGYIPPVKPPRSVDYFETFLIPGETLSYNAPHTYNNDPKLQIVRKALTDIDNCWCGKMDEIQSHCWYCGAELGQYVMATGCKPTVERLKAVIKSICEAALGVDEVIDFDGRTK